MTGNPPAQQNQQQAPQPDLMSRLIAHLLNQQIQQTQPQKPDQKIKPGSIFEDLLKK
jgi:hypothetical protein